MKHLIAGTFKYFNFKKILFANRSIMKISLGLLLVAIVSSPIGCGSNKDSRFYRGGGYGNGTLSGGGYFIESARGYNMLGHEISLEFRSLNQQQYAHNTQGSRNGPVDIQGEVIFSDSINSFSSRSIYHIGHGDRRYNDHRYNDHRYNDHRYNDYRYNDRRYSDSRYRGGYDYYDPCHIEPNVPFRVSLDPQYGPATMQGNDFGDYELIAYGPNGIIVSLYPVNPEVGGSFLLGHNNPNGQVNVFMEVVVQRIDSVGDCPERRVTFGS